MKERKLYVHLTSECSCECARNCSICNERRDKEAREREVQRWSWNCSPNECAQRAYDLGWTRLEIRDAMEAVKFSKRDIDKVLDAFWELRGENWDD